MKHRGNASHNSENRINNINYSHETPSTNVYSGKQSAHVTQPTPTG